MPAPKQSSSDTDATRERRIKLAIACIAGLATVVTCVVYQKTYKIINLQTGHQTSNPAWVETVLGKFDSQFGQFHTWHYLSVKLPNDPIQYRMASVQSLNEVHFHPPYQQAQHASLLLKTSAKQPPDVVLTIPHGQFQCIFNDCNLRVRFGNQDTTFVRTLLPDAAHANEFHLNNGLKFMEAMQTVKALSIEASFYQEANQRFQFDVSNFKTP